MGSVDHKNEHTLELMLAMLESQRGPGHGHTHQRLAQLSERVQEVRKDLLVEVDVPGRRIVVRDVPGLTAPED